MLAGHVFAAESLYYTAVRLAPRDPVARLALGRYLAARGALKVGAVLMEEARYFGGDPGEVAEQLAPVYAQLGEYGALASLPGSRLRYADRARAEWLKSNPPRITGPDTATVSYEVSDSRLLGRVPIVVDGDTLRATIDGRVRGLVLDTSWARRDSAVRRFAGRADRDPRQVAGVVRATGIGAYTLENLAVSFLPQHPRGTAVIGLDVLGRLAPTFDSRTGRMLLRKSGRYEGDDGILRIATLSRDDGVWVVKRDAVFPIGHPDVQRYLGHGRWTLDSRRGEIVVHEVGEGEVWDAK